MVKQVKFVEGKNLYDLEDRLNAHLCAIDAETHITYDFTHCIAVIETKMPVAMTICCECKYWEDCEDSQMEGYCKKKKVTRVFMDKGCEGWCGR